MKKKNGNFNQAMFDMFGVGSDPMEEEVVEEDIPTEGVMDETAASSAVTDVIPAAASYNTGDYAAPVSAAPYVLVPATYIAPGTEFEGHLKTKGDVEIAGKFTGDIESEGDVTLHTYMEGNITSANLNILDCEFKGDCAVSGRVQINSTSRFAGNIHAGDLICAGVIEGNSEISGNSMFDTTADVQGDIITGTMTMERGASISGKLTMKGSRR